MKYVNNQKNNELANKKSDVCTANVTLDQYNNNRYNNIISKLCKQFIWSEGTSIFNITNITLGNIKTEVKTIEDNRYYELGSNKLYVNKKNIELKNNNIFGISSLNVLNNDALVVIGIASSTGRDEYAIAIDKDGNNMNLSLYDLFQTESTGINFENNTMYIRAIYESDPDFIDCDNLNDLTSNSLLMKEGTVTYEGGKFISTITKTTYVKDVCVD